MRLSIFVLLLNMLFVLGLSACDSTGLSLLSDVGKTPATSTTYTETSLMTGNYVDSSAVTRQFEMFKLINGTAAPTYVQWIPNTSGTTAGAVLIFLPYNGINWSDLTIDATWYAKGTGAHADVEEPSYDVSSNSVVNFTAATPSAVAVEGFPYSFNNLHVLIVYGRFYTGQNAQNDIDDVKNGLRFLHAQSVVDKTKIGLQSKAWGAAGVFYSVAQLGATYMPKAISTLYPVSDFKKLVDYVDVTVPGDTVNATVLRNYSTAFDPYYRRINAATAGLSGPTRYDSYRQSQLATITSKVFVAHDDWDTMVPVSSTNDLVTALTAADTTSYFQRHATGVVRDTFTIGHSQVTEAMNNNMAMSWNYTFLIGQLTSTSAPRTSLYSSIDLDAQMAHVIAMDTGGNSVFYNKVLDILCQTNLQMRDTDNVNADMSGPDLLMTALNTAFGPGWAASGADACAQLTGAPPF